MNFGSGVRNPVTLTVTKNIKSLENYLALQLAADDVKVIKTKLLSGGAIQENWLVDLDCSGGENDGVQHYVLRTDSPSSVAVSHSRPQEYQLIKAAFDQGVTVPKPILLCEDLSVIDRPFYIMECVGGSAIGAHIIKQRYYKGDMEDLAYQLGYEMAKIHKITPETNNFDFLKSPSRNPGLTEIERYRAYLDELGVARPVLELGLRSLELIALPWEKPVLTHNDFRTGNYMVDEKGLTAILDWEFSGWSDPHEDMGWFQAMCWRFGARDKPAGGVGSADSFYKGYAKASDLKIDTSRVRFWEVFAHIRWGVIALQQADRHLNGGEKNLNLALTGRMLPEMEFEILTQINPEIIFNSSNEMAIETFDQPDAKDLLETTASLLKEKLLPSLDGDAKFSALMAINAINISTREISNQISPFDVSKICTDIRNGIYDAPAERDDLSHALIKDVVRRLKISNPKYLKAAQN